MKFTCPSCNTLVRRVSHKPRKLQYKWYEFSGAVMCCPFCGAQLELERKSERWALLVLPLLVFLPLTLVLPADETAVEIARYVVWALALLGMFMLFLKRRIVAVDTSSGQGEA